MSEVGTHTHVFNDEMYSSFLQIVQANASMVHTLHGQFYVTDAAHLMDTFIQNIPAGYRQIHECQTCRRFMRKYGSLATLDKDSNLVPVFWNIPNIPELYRPAFYTLRDRICKSKIKYPLFVNNTEHTLGIPETLEYTGERFEHFHLNMNSSMMRMHSTDLPMSRVKAEAIESKVLLRRALWKYSTNTFEKAKEIMQFGNFHRKEKFLPVLQFLVDISSKPRTDNMLWKEITSRPKGFFHINSSVIGSFLEDVRQKTDTNSIERRFNRKVSPDVYQRPQAPPKENNITNAERVIKTYGYERSLERRMATIDEVTCYWRPSKPVEMSDGLFDHLRESQTYNLRDIHSERYTWIRFIDELLPSAQKIEFLADTNFYGGVTAPVHFDAPNIMKWNNAYSWYTYLRPVPPSKFGLYQHHYIEVTGIGHNPSAWGAVNPLFIKDFIFLKGAKDSENPGLCLFPETLNSKLREIRATIEAYSKSKPLEIPSGELAYCLHVDKDLKAFTLRITTKTNLRVTVIIDRWN